MATCTVSGTLKDLSETAIQNAVISAHIINPIFSGTTHILPKDLSTTSDSNGAWSLSILRTASCIITIEYPPNSTDSRIRKTYSISVPDAGTADFSSLATEL